MPCKQIPEYVHTLLEELYDPRSNIRASNVRLAAAFRRQFPLMSSLIGMAESFRLDLNDEPRQLLIWHPNSGRPVGWICLPVDPIPKSAPVLNEHRLLCGSLGAIEELLGNVSIPSSGYGVPGLPTLFWPTKRPGIGGPEEGGKVYWYIRSRRLESESIPNPDSFVMFGGDGESDKWVYTLEDKQVYLLCFGGEPMKPEWLQRVKATPLLYKVKGGETFTEFVEFFASCYLKTLGHDAE